MANGALERKLERMRTHGWFHTPNRPGDRTLEQQMTGLGPMFDEVPGKTVLDVGCAEGLISIECARRGAVSTHGVEFVAGHIEIARGLASELPGCTFEVANANGYQPRRAYDVVLLLAILHKLVDPDASCRRLASAARDLCVIRLGPDRKDVIIDARSNNVPQYIGRVMVEIGFRLEHSEAGPLGEWTWYYRRLPSAPGIG